MIEGNPRIGGREEIKEAAIGFSRERKFSQAVQPGKNFIFITIPSVLRFTLVLALLVSACSLLAQRPASTFPGGSSGSNQGARNSGSGGQRESAPDTFGIFIFNVDNPNEERAYSDSLLKRFHQYDPTRLVPNDYAHLGVVGSAHQPMIYEGRDRGGFSLGWHQYDLYYTSGRTMPFYRLERPYTDLFFTQGAEQRDNIISAKFSRNFANGLNYALDYRAITQEAQDVQYPNQRNQTRALGTGLWFHSSNGRYDGFLSYAANTTNTEDNGGVLTLPDLGDEFPTPQQATVFLNDGQSRHALREIMYTQYYRIGGKIDSTGRAKRAFTLSHQLDYDRNTYRFGDDYSVADDSFYMVYPLLRIDERGARYLVEQRSIENSFRLSTFRLASGDRQQERQQKDLVEVGLTHRYNDLYLEPRDTVINNLMLTGKIGLRPGKRLRLQVDGLLALWEQAGDYRVKGQLDADLGKAGRLQLNLRNQLYTPTLLQSRFLLMQKELYNFNFAKTLETNFGAIYELEQIGLQLGGHYHLIDNFIYFDETATPQQATDPLSIVQFSAQKDFRVGSFSLLNRVVLQQTDEDVLRLPQLFGKHSLVYNGLWFKVLNVQLGADLRYTSGYRPDYYNPIIAQFHQQNQQELDFFPTVDAYFSMRVSRFRAFIKMENMNTFWEQDDRFYTAALYPWPAASVRWGVSWRMLD